MEIEEIIGELILGAFLLFIAFQIGYEKDGNRICGCRRRSFSYSGHKFNFAF